MTRSGRNATFHPVAKAETSPRGRDVWSVGSIAKIGINNRTGWWLFNEPLPSRLPASNTPSLRWGQGGIHRWGREHLFEYISSLRCPLSAPSRSSKALIRRCENIEFQTQTSCFDPIFGIPLHFFMSRIFFCTWSFFSSLAFNSSHWCPSPDTREDFFFLLPV